MKPTPKKQALKAAPKKAEPNLALPAIKKWGISVGLVVFVFILYGDSIMHNYALDDDIITRRNAFVQEGIKGLKQIFSNGFLYGFNGANDQSYRPVTLASIAIEKQIGGNNPHIHHFFNVFWYAVTAVFLFLTLLKLFRKYNYVVPLLITLLYVAHPVHTEVVANIKSRDEILSFLFCILSIYFAWDYFQLKKSNWSLAASCAFFFLATLSKEQSITFSTIIPLIFYFFSDFTLNLKNRFGKLGAFYERLPVAKVNWKKLVSLLVLSAPYVMVVGLYSLIRANVLTSFTFSEKMQVINNSLMAAHNGSERLATVMFVMGKYLKLLFFPQPLSWDYSYNQIPIHTWASIGAFISVCAYLALGIYAIIRFRKKDPISFGIIYYFITMLLVSNLFISIGSSMGERFLYTPSLGFCMALAFVLFRVLNIKINAFKPKLATLYAVTAVILLAFSVKTIARNSEWQDNYTLFESGVTTSPNSARAHQAMAITYTDSANKINDPAEKSAFFSKAIKEYYAALKILPTYSEALYNLGWNYYSMGNYDSAAVAFEKCIKADPKYTPAYQDLGVIYFNRKDYTTAISIFESSLAANPTDADACGNIGAAFYNLGRYDSCIFYCKKALQINPGLSSARENLAKAQHATELQIK